MSLLAYEHGYPQIENPSELDLKAWMERLDDKEYLWFHLYFDDLTIMLGFTNVNQERVSLRFHVSNLRDTNDRPIAFGAVLCDPDYPESNEEIIFVGDVLSYLQPMYLTVKKEAALSVTCHYLFPSGLHWTSDMTAYTKKSE
jgi:hypothetical protein